MIHSQDVLCPSASVQEAVTVLYWQGSDLSQKAWSILDQFSSHEKVIENVMDSVGLVTKLSLPMIRRGRAIKKSHLTSVIPQRQTIMKCPSLFFFSFYFAATPCAARFGSLQIYKNPS